MKITILTGDAASCTRMMEDAGQKQGRQIEKWDKKWKNGTNPPSMRRKTTKYNKKLLSVNGAISNNTRTPLRRSDILHQISSFLCRFFHKVVGWQWILYISPPSPRWEMGEICQSQIGPTLVCSQSDKNATISSGHISQSKSIIQKHLPHTDTRERTTKRSRTHTHNTQRLLSVDCNQNNKRASYAKPSAISGHKEIH